MHAFAAILALAAVSPGPDRDIAADAIPFTIDAAHSHVGFSVRHLGLTRVRGSFADVSGTLAWVADDPAASSVTVLIGVASIDTRNERRDEDLRENFFHTERYPRMAFQSTGVRLVDGALTMTGILRIKDVSRPVTLEGQALGDWRDEASGDRRVAFEAGVVIDRREFGVVAEGHPAERRLVIGYDVEITIEIEALLPAYADTPYPGGDGSAAGILDRELGADTDLDLAARWRTLRAEATDSLDFSARAIALLGFKLLGRGNADAAIDAFSLYESEAGEPAPTTFEWLGHALARAGRDADAEASYRRALSLDATRAGSIEMLRRVTDRSGDWTIPDAALQPAEE